MVRSAIFSADLLYRYRLSRRWSRGPRILWIMLNPSTADHERDDPTIRRCIAFSRTWGFGAMTAVNLFALRTPDAEILRRHSEPIGPDNDAHISAAAARADQIVVAWGAFSFAAHRAREVLALIPRALSCLGQTRNGAPRHPLYLSSRARRCVFHYGHPAANADWKHTKSATFSTGGAVDPSQLA